jgi:plastocyanin
MLTAGLPVAVQAQPATQVISLANFAYAPQPIHLRANQPVTLTFVNRASGGHDFTAPAFFAASRILAGTAPRGEIELRGGETHSIALVPHAGTYAAHSSHVLHKQMGMRTKIVVD